MSVLVLLLYLLALIAFLLATIGVPVGRISLIAAGLFCWLLAFLLDSRAFDNVN